MLAPPPVQLTSPQPHHEALDDHELIEGHQIIERLRGELFASIHTGTPKLLTNGCLAQTGTPPLP